MTTTGLRENAFRDLPVLVTGGAGFIGSHLVDALRSRGARVRVIDDLSSGRRENLEDAGHDIELVEGDIRDRGTCRRACEGIRVVFHQAARGSVPRSIADPSGTIAINVAGTAEVFAAAREAGALRLVYASSSSVYGDSPRLPKREGQEGRALSPYALSKQVDEQLAEVFERCYGMELVGLRYFNVYGPRQDPDGPYAAVIPRFFRASLRGEAPVIYGDGTQTRDFTFVADAVEANLLAATAPRAACGKAFNVATGRQTTLLQLAELIGEIVGGRRPPVFEPPRPGDVTHSLADVSAAGEMLGYRARTSLQEGLRASRVHYASLFGSVSAGTGGVGA